MGTLFIEIRSRIERYCTFYKKYVYQQCDFFIEKRSRIEQYYARSVRFRFWSVFIENNAL